MGFFRKKKDKRVDEITAWAEGYIEEQSEGEPESVAVENVTEESAVLEVDRVVIEGDVQEAGELFSPQIHEESQKEESTAILEVEEIAEDAPAGEESISITEKIEEVKEVSKPSLFQRLRSGLSKTREGLVGKIDRLFTVGRKLDSDIFEKLEEILIESDIGVQQSLALIERIQQEAKRRDLADPEKIKGYLRNEITEILKQNRPALSRPEQGPYVIMVVGVNGVGKTTSIAKLAWRFIKAGERVLLAAGDTFRAAATEQLEIWGERVGADVVKHQSGSDPSAVVFDALKAAESRGVQVVIADTAGRLHTKVNLMEELKKMKRVMGKLIPGAPHEILLVLDATTGQNALSQAKTFHEAVGVTGIVLTKLDGTAKGGILTAIVGELGLPVKLIGIGEGMEDLRDFEPEEFVSALFDG
jgi:fused signal recognition particle receptor